MIERILKDAKFAAEVFREVFPCKYTGVLDCPLCGMPGMQIVTAWDGEVRFFCPYCMSDKPKGKRAENLYFLTLTKAELEKKPNTLTRIDKRKVYQAIDTLAVSLLLSRS